MTKYKHPKKISQLEWLALLGFTKPCELSDAVDFIINQIDGIDSYYNTISEELLRYIKTLCKVHKLFYKLDYDKYGNLAKIRFMNEVGGAIDVGGDSYGFSPAFGPDNILVFRHVDSGADEMVIRDAYGKVYVIREPYLHNTDVDYESILSIMNDPGFQSLECRYCFVDYELRDDCFPPNLAIYDSATKTLRFRLYGEVLHVKSE